MVGGRSSFFQPGPPRAWHAHSQGMGSKPPEPPGTLRLQTLSGTRQYRRRTDPQVLGCESSRRGGRFGHQSARRTAPPQRSQCTFRREFEARYRPSDKAASHMMTSDFVTKEPPGGGQPGSLRFCLAQLDLGYQFSGFRPTRQTKVLTNLCYSSRTKSRRPDLRQPPSLRGGSR